MEYTWFLELDLLFGLVFFHTREIMGQRFAISLLHVGRRALFLGELSSGTFLFSMLSSLSNLWENFKLFLTKKSTD